MMRAAILALLLLTGCDDSGSPPVRRATAPSNAVTAWEIGPIVGTRNYSLGLPVNPTKHPEGFEFAISPTAEPHYITKATGPLTAYKAIRMRYRVEGPSEAHIYGKGCSEASGSAVTLYIEHKADDWSRDGYRWWATQHTVALTGPVEAEIVAPLDGYWSSVFAFTTDTHRAVFNDAKANAARIGFTFANCEGYGHGTRSTLPVKFIVTYFGVE